MVCHALLLLAVFAKPSMGSQSSSTEPTAGQLLSGLRTSGGHPVVILTVPLPDGDLSEESFSVACSAVRGAPICQGGPSCSFSAIRTCVALTIEEDHCGQPMWGLAKRLGFKNPGSTFFSNICVSPGIGWTFQDGVCGGPGYYNHANLVLGQRYTVCAASEPATLRDAFLPEIGACEVNGDCITSPAFPRSYFGNGLCTLSVVHNGVLEVEQFRTHPHSDKLTVGGVAYSGDSGPNGINVKSGDVIEWKTHHGGANMGWKICLHRSSALPALQRKVKFLQRQEAAARQNWTAQLKNDRGQIRNLTAEVRADQARIRTAKAAARTASSNASNYVAAPTPSKGSNPAHVPATPPDAAAALAAVAAEARVAVLSHVVSRERHQLHRLHRQVQKMAFREGEMEFQMEQARLSYLNETIALQEQSRLEDEVRAARRKIIVLIVLLVVVLSIACWALSAKEAIAVKRMGNLFEPLLSTEGEVSRKQQHFHAVPFEPRSVVLVDYDDALGRKAKCIRVEVPGREMFTGRRTVRGSVQELGSHVRLMITKQPDLPRQHSLHANDISHPELESGGTWEKTFALGFGHWAVVGPVPASEGLGPVMQFDEHGIWEVHVAQVAKGTQMEDIGRKFSVCPQHDLSLSDESDGMSSQLDASHRYETASASHSGTASGSSQSPVVIGIAIPPHGSSPRVATNQSPKGWVPCLSSDDVPTQDLREVLQAEKSPCLEPSPEPQGDASTPERCSCGETDDQDSQTVEPGWQCHWQVLEK